MRTSGGKCAASRSRQRLINFALLDLWSMWVLDLILAGQDPRQDPDRIVFPLSRKGSKTSEARGFLQLGSIQSGLENAGARDGGAQGKERKR